jgi:hypothetical protein
VTKNLSGSGPPREPRKRGRTPSLSARAKVERDNQIIRLKLQGRTWSSICEELGVPTATARLAYYTWRDRQSLLITEDPLSWLNEQLGIYGVLFEDLGELRAQLREVKITDEHGKEHVLYEKVASTGEQIAAIAQQRGLVKDAVRLRQMGGLLPSKLNRIRTELDVRYVANQIVRILNEDGVPVATRERLIAALEEAR